MVSLYLGGPTIQEVDGKMKMGLSIYGVAVISESLYSRFYLIIESVDSISKDERGFPLTQYITNGRISRGGYTFTQFKHHHRVLRLISYSMSV